MVTNSKEEACYGNLILLAIVLAKTNTCNTILITKNLGSIMLKEHLDIWSVEKTLLHSL
jgi:hypothetical protein